MRLTRTFVARFSLALATGTGAFLVLVGILNCSTYPTYKDVPVNCAVENDYEFSLIDDFTNPNTGWFAASDYAAPAKYDAGADANVPGTTGVEADAGARTAGSLDASTHASDAAADVSASAVVDAGQESDDARLPLAPRILAPVPTYTSVGTTIQTSGGTGTYTSRSSISIATIPDGPLCGHTNAGVFQSTHNNDWGGMFGKWDFASTAGSKVAKYEGISFWARAPGNTTKTFKILLDDDNTSSLQIRCRVYSMTDGGTSDNQSSTAINATDPGTGTPITGNSNTRASYPDECGNSYWVQVKVTSAWQFHRVPWDEFQQSFTPNGVPNEVLSGDADAGTRLLISSLRNLVLRMPKEAEMELWLANLAFYGRKAQ